MNILVIEDDHNKRQQLVDFICETRRDAHVEQTKSYQSGLRSLVESRYDLVFLDMTMPTFDRSPTESGGRVRPFAGRDILVQLDRREVISYVIVFTQFSVLGDGDEQVSVEDLDIKLRSEFPMTYRGYVHYDTARNDWKAKVEAILSECTKEDRR
ncbi:response regulator [Paraburkholderia denitrificans]|uniref:Response regulator n=1 Tax=Paraburkholderia denitrificans TaxID=694025 RepID=A0ABW0J8Z3_9BURK